jgi:2-oxo-4-hydroxy-4-carboxy--5-ureidoimidazoline (OHCU) decarboxylase
MAESTITKLPPAPELSSLPDSTRATILDLLFEPSPTLHNIFLPLTSFQKFFSYDDLVAAIGVKLLSLAESSNSEDLKQLEDVLSSHPRLGEKKVDSAMSRMEQAAMLKASGSGGEEDEAKVKEAETLKQLNREYEEAFPGLRYVVFVNGRPRTVIFENMRERIKRGDIGEERREAIKVCLLWNEIG